MVTFKQSRLLIGYIIAASALMTAISIFQYFRYNMFGTNLMLGWDSPAYVWLAKDAIAKGPLYVIGPRNYPHFYVQLLALLGYLSGNVIIIERTLPLFFGTLLIFANAKLTLKISKNIHIAGLAAFLTAVSLNALRLQADLNRNLMALSLSFLSFLLISDFTSQNAITWKSLLNRKYLSTILIFFIIAGTQFETFFVLCLSLILLGILTRNVKKLLMLTLTWAIPTTILLSLFPQILSRYLASTWFVTYEITFNELLLWAGGSWTLLGFLIAGATYSFYKAIRYRDTLASIIFSWVVVIALLVTSVMFKQLPLPSEYALRALLVMPIPVLLALAVSASADVLKGIFLEIGVSSPTKTHAIRINVRLISSLAIALVLVASSITITSQHYDEFLTPYIPYSSYEKISTASYFLIRNGLSKPVVVFYGEHSTWFINLYWRYIGAEIGEHFVFYGDVEYILWYIATRQPYSGGNLTSCPMLIITPYLYDKEIPYYITPFHIGQGVYVIPSSSSITSEVAYGSTVTVTGDSGPIEVKSEYLYADQNDPSRITLRVASKGYRSYTFTNYPSDWTFFKLEQGGALSYPEKNPSRLNGTNAIEGNDPAESTQDWSTLQTATISIVNSSKKEGSASLRVMGTVDSWGNLGARYDPAGTWDLSTKSLLAVWAMSNEKTAFSITLHDAAGNSRTFWAIQAYGSSADTQWKRFAVNLSNYTSQTPDFDLTKVDYADFYVSSNPGRKMSLSLDDLIIDDIPPVNEAVHKARVLNKDAVAAYFTVLTA